MKTTILLIIINCLNLTGQSLEEDLNRMYKQYEGTKNLYIEMESTVYENKEQKASMKTVVKKQDGQYLYEMKDQAMLINNNYLVVVNHQNKLITYDRWTAFQAKKMASSYVPVPKDLLTKYPTVKYEGEKLGIRHYSLHNDKIQMSRLDIFFDTKTGFVKKTIHHYNPNLVKEATYMEMEFKKIEVQPQFDAETFSEKKFILITDKYVKAIDKYKNYKLHAAQSYNNK